MIEDGLVRERLMAKLSGFFGLLAAVLAIIGLYGLISYLVVRRRNEIGIRMALGANRTRVVGLVMSEGLLLLGLGLVAGNRMAVVRGKAAATMPYGLEPGDAATVTMALAGLRGV